MAASLAPRLALAYAVQPEAHYLIEAVAATPLPRVQTPGSRGVVDRAVWVLDLFERLERRDQLLRSGRTS